VRRRIGLTCFSLVVDQVLGLALPAAANELLRMMMGVVDLLFVVR
jgi:hypothetical protein